MPEGKSIVFLGPSATLCELPDIPSHLELRPPIRRGDIDGLIASSLPSTIGIIDGQFMQSFSISPKEILSALDLGVKVYGASSIGALRAVELEPFGMVGIGRVFEWYRDSKVDGDDEVAMLYAPESMKAMSIPLINIRIAVSDAVAENVISNDNGKKLLTCLKHYYFPERTWELAFRCLSTIADSVETLSFKTYVASQRPDAKRDDAAELIRAVLSGE